MEIINYNGKQIYYLDASNSNTKDLQEIEKDMNAAMKLIAGNPLKSALVMVKGVLQSPW